MITTVYIRDTLVPGVCKQGTQGQHGGHVFPVPDDLNRLRVTRGPGTSTPTTTTIPSIKSMTSWRIAGSPPLRHSSLSNPQVLIKNSHRSKSAGKAFRLSRTRRWNTRPSPAKTGHLFSSSCRCFCLRLGRPSDKRPAAVFFHGGGWHGGGPDHYYPQSRYVALRGMVAISVEYRTINRFGTTPKGMCQGRQVRHALGEGACRGARH